MFYHSPIQIKNLSFILPHKICFENFSTTIHPGDRIAIIGRNGIGKSTILQAIQNKNDLIEGEINVPEDIVFGYVPQTVQDNKNLSGGQRFNKALTKVLALNPNILLLDEPTNHLDLNNRKSLMQMLKYFPGTLIVATHDVELLNNCIDKLWHIDDKQIKIFSGNYDHYLNEIKLKRGSIEKKLVALNREKKATHHSLMKEQARAKRSRLYGEKKTAEGSWPPIVAKGKKLQAQFTAGKKKKEIHEKKQELTEELSKLRLPEVIKPKFSLTAENIGNKNILSISEGSIGYEQIIIKDIHLSLTSKERIAISGDNGSGKSTLIKGILCEPDLTQTGTWHIPKQEVIGYLDQHYANFDPKKTVFQTISKLVPDWTDGEVRKHLNDFLFRKNEEVDTLVKDLSGGERVRLSLAKIAAKTPRLLILDEITNNIDLETRDHVVEVLKEYPGAMIIISHDENFLQEIGIDSIYEISKKRIEKISF